MLTTVLTYLPVVGFLSLLIAALVQRRRGRKSGKKKRSKTVRPKSGPYKEFYAQVVGATFENPNGQDRQEVVEDCEKGDEVLLIHEPCPQDNNAVKVCRKNGDQIGYLKKELAQALVKSGEIIRATAYVDKIVDITFENIKEVNRIHGEGYLPTAATVGLLIRVKKGAA